MKYWAFYKERIPELPQPNDKGEAVVRCIFHSDANPSLSINIESGKWKCFTPTCAGHAGGGWKKFDQLLKGEIPNAGDLKPPPIDVAAIEGFHQVLLRSPTPLATLHEKRGMVDETIARHKLGWDGDRILIPIHGPDGSILNVRKYAYGAQKDKMIAWGPRYNRARLYPIETLKSEWILLCEGELDALVAEQHGYPAMSVTSGADTWLEEFNEQLKGKRVFLCYDVDKAGKSGSRQIARKLLKHAASVHLVTLPLSGSKEEKDVTDYFVHLKHSNADFDALLEQAEEVKENVKATEAPAAEAEPIHLSLIGEDRLVNKRIETTVLVAGKDLAPFQVPKRVSFACPAVGSEKACERCSIARGDGTFELEIPNWSSDLLQMVNVPIEKLNAQLSRAAGVPFMCPKWTFEVKEYENIESIKAIPEIDFTSEQSKYVIRSLGYIGHGIETNRTYRIKAVVMPDPKTQYATALIYEATPSQDSIEKFDIDGDIRNSLSIFKVEGT